MITEAVFAQEIGKDGERDRKALERIRIRWTILWTQCWKVILTPASK